MTLISGLWRDVRMGGRVLARRPGVTCAAVLSLALGVGLNISIFTLVSSLLLEPLPARDPDRLVTVYTSDFSGPRYGASSYADFEDFRGANDALSDLAAYTLAVVNLADGARTLRAHGEVVSPNYFTLLGVRPQLGRAFTASDEPVGAATAPMQSAPAQRTPAQSAPAAASGSAAAAVTSISTDTPVIVLGYRFWQRQFNSDPAMLGRVLTINARPFTVIGIAPERFPGTFRGLATDFWMPAAAYDRLTPGPTRLTERGSRAFMLIGRLAPGRGPSEAQGRFAVIAERLQRAYPEPWTDRTGARRQITVLDEFSSRLSPEFRGQVTQFLALLFGLVFLVLLIACANVAGLLLARAAGRQREMAVRLSLGASRARLVRQLLVESVLLAALAGTAGLLIAQWATALIVTFQPPVSIPIYVDLAINPRVLLFAVGLSALTAGVFGLAPALQSARPDVVTALKGHAARTGPRRARLRHGLIVFQVAASLALLITAGLFARSLAQWGRADLGFEPTQVAQLTVNLGERDEAAGRLLYAELVSRVEALPGVRSAALAVKQPLGLSHQRRRVRPTHYDPARGEDMEVWFNQVGARFFETLRVPVVEGRAFTDQDREGAPKVAIVNEAFARRYWPGRRALGEGISVTGPEGEALPVVGIVKNAAFTDLSDRDLPMFFLPLAQHHRDEALLFVRAGTDPSGLLGAVRAEIRRLDPTLLVFDEKTLADAMGLVLVPNRIAATLLGGAGLLGLLLAAVGLFALLAQLVSERTREIGIRMALGAERTAILRMIVGRGLRLTAAGLAAGLLLAWGCGRLTASWLFGVSPQDPLTFMATPIVLLGVTLVSSYLPARRAARVNPIDALRQD